jgi:spore coat protein U-like protein
MERSPTARTDNVIRRSRLMRAGEIAVAAFALAAGIYAAPSRAATDTTTFNVTATVIAACNVTATDLGFGNYDAASGTANDATSTVTVICSNGTTFDVALDAGTTAGAAVNARLLTDGTDTLSYALYSDAGRTTLWGDNTSGTSDVSGTGDGTNQNLTVYGRIPVSQYVTAGAYSDTITVTVTY